MPELGQLHCRENDRRQAVLRSSFNGIDYVEIWADTLDRQRFLHVHFLKTPVPAGLDGYPGRFSVEGGVRVRDIRVVEVSTDGDHLVVEVDQPGDFSTYELVIDHEALDPVFARCAFSFKAGCPSRFDCRPGLICPPPPAAPPVIDYLAKDYASFRRALLDLAPTLVPDWKERHEADLGIALVELLAYAGDHLSYYQDAVANEAYLETARRRVSVRRHARLVDYRMHDGASARTFVHFAVDAAGAVPQGTPVLTRIDIPLGDHRPPHAVALSDAVRQLALPAAAAAFETMHGIQVHPDLNEVAIHAWGNDHCCLPRGATTVDLVGDLTEYFAEGDFLLFEEVRGPHTGLIAEGDPGHRQVVRLTSVERTEDPIGDRSEEPPAPLALTRIAWDAADALTFPLCITARLSLGPRRGEVESRVSLARGNMALTDHGRGIRDETHPGPETPRFPSLSGPYRVRLREGPLSFRIPLLGSEPVAELLGTSPQRALARVEVELASDTGISTDWFAAPHLLDSRPFEPHFTVETDNDARAVLRFGDGEYGMAPPEGSTVNAGYHVGVGQAGNIGADTLRHLIDPGTLSMVTAVRNPLPAWGGVEPEPLERVKRLAPEAFRAETVRAVTEEDYARAAEKHHQVAKAVATFRWTGSWHTVFVTVDRRGGLPVDADFEGRLRAFLERSRLAGYDLEIDGPVLVPLEIEIDVCVAPDHFRGQVEAALVMALSRYVLPDRSLGFFHPDNFTFGQPVFISRLYAAVEAIAGVEGAEIRVFKRYHRPTAGEIRRGFIPMGRLEIARLDNDPNRPEHGVLRLNMEGGK